jgi:hypothetical protein
MLPRRTILHQRHRPSELAPRSPTTPSCTTVDKHHRELSRNNNGLRPALRGRPERMAIAHHPSHPRQHDLSQQHLTNARRQRSPTPQQHDLSRPHQRPNLSRQHRGSTRRRRSTHPQQPQRPDHNRRRPSQQHDFSRPRPGHARRQCSPRPHLVQLRRAHPRPPLPQCKHTKLGRIPSKEPPFARPAT